MVFFCRCLWSGINGSCKRQNTQGKIHPPISISRLRVRSIYYRYWEQQPANMKTGKINQTMLLPASRAEHTGLPVYVLNSFPLKSHWHAEIWAKTDCFYRWMAASNICFFFSVWYCPCFFKYSSLLCLCPLFLSLEFTCAACEKLPHSPLRSKFCACTRDQIRRHLKRIRGSPTFTLQKTWFISIHGILEIHLFFFLISTQKKKLPYQDSEWRPVELQWVCGGKSSENYQLHSPHWFDFIVLCVFPNPQRSDFTPQSWATAWRSLGDLLGFMHNALCASWEGWTSDRVHWAPSRISNGLLTFSPSPLLHLPFAAVRWEL